MKNFDDDYSDNDIQITTTQLMTEWKPDKLREEEKHKTYRCLWY